MNAWTSVLVAFTDNDRTSGRSCFGLINVSVYRLYDSSCTFNSADKLFTEKLASSCFVELLSVIAPSPQTVMIIPSKLNNAAKYSYRWSHQTQHEAAKSSLPKVHIFQIFFCIFCTHRSFISRKANGKKSAEKVQALTYYCSRDGNCVLSEDDVRYNQFLCQLHSWICIVVVVHGRDFQRRWHVFRRHLPLG